MSKQSHKAGQKIACVCGMIDLKNNADRFLDAYCRIEQALRRSVAADRFLKFYELVKSACRIEPLVKQIRAAGLSFDGDIAKVSLVGVGMKSHSGVAYKMFDVLAANKINIEMISTSEIKISVAIRAQEADRAVRALHDAFGMGQAARKRPAPARKKSAKK